MTRLAKLGVAVPEEYRREMAIVGDWQTTSERFIYDEFKKEEETQDVKPNGLNVGVRKRKPEGQDDEEEAGETVARTGWGSTTRTYPGTRDSEADLDILLNSASALQKKEPTELASVITPTHTFEPSSIVNGKSGYPKRPHIKNEDSFEASSSIPLLGPKVDESTVKSEEGLDDLKVMFKKRKPKAIRHK